MRSTDPDGRPLRHARVRLDPSTWRASLVDGLDDARIEHLAAWIDAGRACVARRREPGPTTDCFLAVALPLADDRARIAFRVAARAVVRIEPPLRLDAVIAAAPDAWRSALTDLCARGDRIGTVFHVYGSLAWQAISGECCVRPGSDVDLLWTASDPSHIERVLALLVEWGAASGLRPDGELLLPDGDAVAWRELLGRPDRVLVKHVDRVALRASPIAFA